MVKAFFIWLKLVGNMLNIYVLICLDIATFYVGKHTCLPYNMLKIWESPLQFTVERFGIRNHSFLIDLYLVAATFVNLSLYYLTNKAKISDNR